MVCLISYIFILIKDIYLSCHDFKKIIFIFYQFNYFNNWWKAFVIHINHPLVRDSRWFFIYNLLLCYTSYDQNTESNVTALLYCNSWVLRDYCFRPDQNHKTKGSEYSTGFRGLPNTTGNLCDMEETWLLFFEDLTVCRVDKRNFIGSLVTYTIFKWFLI